MTRQDLLDILGNDRNSVFKKEVIVKCIETLPITYASEIIRLLHLKYIHQGRYIIVTHRDALTCNYYATVNEVLEMVKRVYHPKAFKTNIYDVLQGRAKSAYGLLFRYSEDKSEIKWT